MSAISSKIVFLSEEVQNLWIQASNSYLLAAGDKFL